MSEAVFAVVALLAMLGMGIGIGAVLVSRAVDRDEYSGVMWRTMQAATRLHGAYWAARDAIHHDLASGRDMAVHDDRDQRR
jgi:hypothetical protein